MNSTPFTTASPIPAKSASTMPNNFEQSCVVNERSHSPLIKVSALAYLVVQRPDIEKAAMFFVDYGLLVDRRENDRIYMRGKTDAHHILILEKGSACVSRLGLVATKPELNTLAELYKLPVKSLGQPQGGYVVAIKDPNEIELEIVSDLTPLPPIELDAQAVASNFAREKPRLNTAVRHEIQPQTVHKLGHSLWSVHNIRKTVHWYQDVLGFVVSDFQFLKGDPLPIVAFMRCDQGTTPSDHHTLGFGLAPDLGHLHSAFEMNGFEEIAIASEWMNHKRYSHGWGIGRHILGSQIFDYWRDDYGDMFEHYADGDLFDASVPAGYHLFHAKAQHQWGPDMTRNFKGLNQPLKTLKSVLKRLPTDDDLNIGRLIRMVRSI